jgi:hypothetical protein
MRSDSQQEEEMEKRPGNAAGTVEFLSAGIVAIATEAGSSVSRKIVGKVVMSTNILD